MISAYLNQTATLRAKTGVNEYNESSYAAPLSIACRFEYKRRLIRNETGEQVISEARLFTESAVKPNDLITYDGRDWLVLAVADQPDLGGGISHYEVSL